MSLPSQSGGISSGRSYMASRRRRRKGGGGLARLLLVGLLAGGGAALWWAVSSRGGEEPSTNQPLAAVNGGADQAIPTQALMTGEHRDRVEPARGAQEQQAIRPVVINLGAGASNPAPGETTTTTTTTTAPVDRAPVVQTPTRDTAIPTREMAPPRDRTPAPARPESDGWRGEGEVAALAQRASALRESGDLVGARDALNSALRSARATARDRAALRARMADLNGDLLFSARVYPGDPMTESYTMQREVLSQVVRRMQLGVDWRLISRVNGVRPERLRVGQTIKLVRGPFHAIVDKTAFRLDVWWGPTDQPETWIYIRSFDVGLGEHGSTPNGLFKVTTRLENPGWTNPRTFETFAPNDPKNPIGNYWIGMEGLGESAVHTSLGLHGTIEPDSIGRNLSMGCVRLRDEDIALLFELLTGERSLVRIVP